MVTIVKEETVEFELDYYEYGEEWENDPRQYVEDIFGYFDEAEEILDEVDYEEMVANWSDETLYNVELYGSDLAFNKEQRGAIGDAVQAERVARWEAAGGFVPEHNGMTE